MEKSQLSEPRQEANQTVRLKIDATEGSSSIRIGFTDQRLTAYGGMAVWSHFLRQKSFRSVLRSHIPHQPTSPNAYDPTDTALGFLGGILSGANKLSRVAWLRSDEAISEVLGIEAVPSESSLSRFFNVFDQQTSEHLAKLHRWAIDQLPTRPDGYTLDMDSWALLHEDGHQEGVAPGYTRRGIKPCQRPLVATLAEAQMVAGYRLRPGNTACVNGADEYLKRTIEGLPSHIRLSLVRADSGFSSAKVLGVVEELGLHYIMAYPMRSPVQRLCRHQDCEWENTAVEGLQVQEVEMEEVGRRLIVIRQRIKSRPDCGGKALLEVPGYKFQALITNLPSSHNPLWIWRRYNGRADIENRIKELGDQFGIKGLTCKAFWATEALHHLAITAYNLCVLLQRRLGQQAHCQLQTLRWRLFNRAAIWSRAQGKPHLRLSVHGEEERRFWSEVLTKVTAPPNCNAVGSLSA